ncbi:diol dehydratase small subunit [Parageobacillus toebii]|uniref:diol dehydratase small subunit n=1 Tax=Parageobacillus toebii TaxID=153151 RepID=UPI00196818D9|nr:diol dehydratase small subunit [Parageobacillus toebii]QSB49432.1 diol dehydratase small subunit [Parageobacillus toebii]
MNQALIEQIVKEIMASMNGAEVNTEKNEKNQCVKVDVKHDYPLAEKRPELIKTPTGKSLDEINLKGVIDGDVKPEDIRISPETLELQAQIADSMGRKQFAANLRRAAELIAIPDKRILEIYNALRPYRSTKDELLAIADELEHQYHAKMNAKLVREAAEVYELRDRLRKDGE